MPVPSAVSLKTTRALLLGGVCGFAWLIQPMAAVAREMVPDRPSVEVNLDALRQLQGTAKPAPAAAPAPVGKGNRTSRSAPPAPVAAPAYPAPAYIAPAPSYVAPAPAPAYVQPVAPAQPYIPQQAAPAPVYVPPAAPAPAPVYVPQAPAPVQPYVPQAAPTYRQPVEVQQAPVYIAPKLKPVVVPQPQSAPAPVVEYQPAPAPVYAPAPTSHAKPVARQDQLQALPPSTIIPLKPAAPKAIRPVIAPAPSQEIQKLAPLPVPVGKSGPSLAPLPDIRETPKPKQAVPAEPVAKAPEMLRPISNSPMMVVTPQQPSLPPSVTQRINKTFAPEPAQVGVVRDDKTIKNLTEDMVKPGETKKKPVEPVVVPKPEVKSPFAAQPPEPKDIDAVKKQESAPVGHVDESLLPTALPPAIIPPKLSAGAISGTTKLAEPAPSLPEPAKKDVLPPLPSLPAKPLAVVPAPVPAKVPEPVKPLEPLKLPEPVKKEVAAPAAKSPVLPLPMSPKEMAPVKAPEPLKVPEPSKSAEPVKLLEPAKKDVTAPLPPMLPLPALPGKDEPAIKPPEASKLLTPPKAPEPAKKDASAAAAKPPVLPMPMAPLGKDAKPATPENMPPAELPPAPAPAAEVKQPVVLPKSEIANVPKVDTKSSAFPVMPALPKPPVAAAPEPVKPAEVKKEEEPKHVLALPKLPDAGTPKPALPSLSAITGEKPSSSADVMQPKDAINAKPLTPVGAPSAPPALPKFPVDDKAATVKLPPLPALPAPAAKPEVKPVDVKAAPVAPKVEAPVAKPALATPPMVLPPLPPIPGAPAPKGPIKDAPKTAAAPVAENALPEAGSASAVETTKLSRSLSFAKEKSDLNDDAKSDLGDIAEQVSKSEGNVRIVTYASGTAEQAPQARKLSLARALQIRAFLISKGVNQLNISVQAMGNKVPSGNSDRADIFTK